MTARAIEESKPGGDGPCPCGSGRSLRQCCGRSGEPSEKANAAPRVAGAPRPGPPPPVSLLPDDVTGWLKEEDRLRRRVALRANRAPQSNGDQPQPTEAERRRAAAGFLKKATALIHAGRLADAIPLLRRAAAANPEDSNAFFLLGATLLKCGRHGDAIGPLERTVTLKPNFAEAHHMLGTALQAVGQEPVALAAFRRAVELAPRMVDAHLQLGKLLQNAARFDEAQESFRRAAIAGRNTTPGRICEAMVFAGEKKFAEAANCLRQALARDPGDYFASVLLAQMLATLGEIEPAIAQYQRARARARTPADDPMAIWIGLPQIKKLAEADRPLLAEMEAYLRQEHISPPNRMRLHFALGKGFDDLRNYEEAIRNFDAANRIRHSLYPFHRNLLVQQLDAVIRQHTAQFFAEHEADGVDDETPVLVIGMPRSGTTLVEQVLSSHPRVAGAGELQFWVEQANKIGLDGLGTADAATARRVAGEYIAELRGVSPTAARVTDKMPFNFQLLGLARQAFPRARFIHCRRHPIDTCLSIYFTDFDKMKGFVADRGDLVFYYRHYLRIMEHWRAILPPSCFIEVDYEAMIAEPEAQARRLIDFCGLDWDPACLRPEQNKRTVETASLWQVRQPIYRSSLERWRRYEPWLGSLRELIPPSSANV